MDLDQDPPESLETEPQAAPEADAGEIVEDSGREPEPPSRSAPREDSGRYEREAAREAEARYWREEAERNRRELDNLQAAYRSQPQENDDQLRERLGPEGYILAQFDRQTNAFRASQYAGEIRTAAQIDQLKFENELDGVQRNLGWSADKKAKISAEIENWYGNIARNAMQSGQPLMISRIDLLDKINGREMRTNGARAVKAASDKGRQNISRQSARMTNASSNMTGRSAGKSKAEESLQRMIEAGVVEM